MFSKAQKIDGRNQGSRFGTTAVALGDLDKDGFAGEFNEMSYCNNTAFKINISFISLF
jgi:hypothetical protein